MEPESNGYVNQDGPQPVPVLEPEIVAREPSLIEARIALIRKSAEDRVERLLEKQVKVAVFESAAKQFGELEVAYWSPLDFCIKLNDAKSFADAAPAIEFLENNGFEVKETNDHSYSETQAIRVFQLGDGFSVWCSLKTLDPNLCERQIVGWSEPIAPQPIIAFRCKEPSNEE